MPHTGASPAQPTQEAKSPLLLARTGAQSHKVPRSKHRRREAATGTGVLLSRQKGPRLQDLGLGRDRTGLVLHKEEDLAQKHLQSCLGPPEDPRSSHWPVNLQKPRQGRLSRGGAVGLSP